MHPSASPHRRCSTNEDSQGIADSDHSGETSPRGFQPYRPFLSRSAPIPGGGPSHRPFCSNSPGWVRRPSENGSGDTPSAEDWAAKRFVVIPEQQEEEEEESSDSSLDEIYQNLGLKTYKGPSLFPDRQTNNNNNNHVNGNSNNGSNNGGVGWDHNNNSWYQNAAPQNRNHHHHQHQLGSQHSFGGGESNNFIHPHGGGFNNYHSQQQRTVFARTHTGATTTHFGFAREEPQQQQQPEFEIQGRQPVFQTNFSRSTAAALSTIPPFSFKPAHQSNRHSNNNHNNFHNNSSSNNYNNNNVPFRNSGEAQNFDDMILEDDVVNNEVNDKPFLPNFGQILQSL